MNRKPFYDYIRKNLFGGILSQSQVDGIEAILDFWESPPTPISPDKNFEIHWNIKCIEWLAYILATVYHETKKTMQPIHEDGSKHYFTKRYENRSDLGNNQKGDGAKFHGRGLVQITGRKNYTQFNQLLKKYYPDSPNIISNPDEVLNLNYSIFILFYGMIMGTFTGKALKHYIGNLKQGQKVNFINARRIVNGTDRAEMIADYANKFLIGLKKAYE